jgi:hypothetical protein
MKPRWVFEFLGASLLLVMPFTAQLLFPGASTLLHNPRSFSSLVLGLGIDALAVFVIGFAIFTIVPRLARLPRNLFTGLLCGLISWWISVSVVIGVSLLPTSEIFPHMRTLMDHAQVLLLHLNLPIVAFFIAFAILEPGAVRAVAGALRLSLAAFSVCALWVVPEMVHLVFLRPVGPFDHSAALSAPASGPRVVWVLFDELSQDLTFDHPIAGATYPNFAVFRSSSVFFDNIETLGLNTDRAVPSLLTGRVIQEVRSNSNGDLVTLDAPTRHWVPYETENTLFDLARDTDWRPAVVGWYNPYCRTFESVLSACYWEPGIQDLVPIQMLGASLRGSAWQNARTIPQFIFGFFFSALGGKGFNLQEQNLQDYQSVLRHSEQLIANDKFRFVFLHLPVPHPPGLYDRRTHQLCACGNYFDNIALADDLLGQLLRQINATPDAARTTVIVSSDHSWRISLWKDGVFWTPEEQRIAAHFSDARPVFLVHFPGQQQGINISAATPELIEHDIIAALLQQKLSTPQSLVDFVHTAAPPALQTPPHP